MRIFRGFAGEGASNESGVGKVFFSDFRTICRNIAKTVHSSKMLMRAATESYYTKLLQDANRKSYASYRMVSLSLPLSDPCRDPDFKRRAGLSATAGLSCLIKRVDGVGLFATICTIQSLALTVSDACSRFVCFLGRAYYYIQRIRGITHYALYKSRLTCLLS